jgi:hypothetical protein
MWGHHKRGAVRARRACFRSWVGGSWSSELLGKRSALPSPEFEQSCCSRRKAARDDQTARVRAGVIGNRRRALASRPARPVPSGSPRRANASARAVVIAALLGWRMGRGPAARSAAWHGECVTTTARCEGSPFFGWRRRIGMASSVRGTSRRHRRRRDAPWDCERQSQQKR